MRRTTASVSSRFFFLPLAFSLLPYARMLSFACVSSTPNMRILAREASNIRLHETAV